MWLSQSDTSKRDNLEGQLEASVCERVFAGMDDTLITDDQIPEVLRTSHDNHFNLSVTSVYMSATDWQRIVEKGEKDELQRNESREDVWQCWLKASSPGSTSSQEPSWHFRR